MKKLKLISFLASALLMILASCSDDNGFEQGSDYDYPFTFNVDTQLQGVQGIEIPLKINIEETGTITNPNKDYTLSFTSSGQATLITDAGIIYNPDQKIEFQFNQETEFKINYLPSSFGNHSVIYKIKNSAGREVTQTVNYTIEEGSYSISVDEQNKEDYQGNEITYTLKITENVASTEPYQISVQNATTPKTIKINNQVVQENSFVNLSNLTDNKVTLIYNEAGVKNPTIVVKNQNKTQSLSVNTNVLKYDLTLNGSLKYKFHNYATGADQMIDITANELKKKSCYEELLYLEGTSLITQNPNNDISLYVGSSLGTIENVVYKNVSYPVNTYFSIDKTQIGNIKLKLKSTKIYGDEIITIKVKDNFGNESTQFSKNYLLFDDPTVNNTSTNLHTYYKLGTVPNGYNSYNRAENISAINITGNGKEITNVKVKFELYKNYISIYQGTYANFNYNNVETIDFSETINNVNISLGVISGSSNWLFRMQIKVTNIDNTVVTKTIEVQEDGTHPTSI